MRLAIIEILLFPLLLYGQDMSVSQLQTYEALIRQARVLTDAAAAEVRSKDTWEPQREQRLHEMRDMLGLLPWPERAPPFLRLAVYPRGIGETCWNKTFWKSALRNAMHTGQSVDSLRLWDVLRAVEFMRGQPTVDPDRITVAGKGVSGIIALYTALLDEKIEQALLLSPPETHADGPLFLNVLRHLDIPAAAALLAPRRLNFYSRMPEAFNPVREIYSLYGKPDHLFLTMDISNILERKYHHNYSSGL